MTLVNMHEAKTHLSRLIERMMAGEEIVIARAGKPVAKLVPYERPPTKRIAGRYRGQIHIVGDIDDSDAEIQELFEADDDELL